LFIGMPPDALASICFFACLDVSRIGYGKNETRQVLSGWMKDISQSTKRMCIECNGCPGHLILCDCCLDR
jgi:hypothetical protein